MINIEKQYDDIYSKYYRVILNFAMAKGVTLHIAEDITGETLARLWEKRNECKFDNADPEVSERALRAWLYKTAMNVLYEHWRNTPDDSSLDDLNGSVADIDNIQNCVEDIRYQEYIETIERQLTHQQKIIFRMIFIQHLSYDETEIKLNIKGTTLRSTISRLRKMLRPYIDNLIDHDK